MVGALIYLTIYIIIVGVILWLLTYLLDNVPIAEPFRRVGKIVILVVGVLIVILLLLNFIGALDGGNTFPRVR